MSSRSNRKASIFDFVNPFSPNNFLHKFIVRYIMRQKLLEIKKITPGIEKSQGKNTDSSSSVDLISGHVGDDRLYGASGSTLRHENTDGIPEVSSKVITIGSGFDTRVMGDAANDFFSRNENKIAISAATGHHSSEALPLGGTVYNHLTDAESGVIYGDPSHTHFSQMDESLDARLNELTTITGRSREEILTAAISLYELALKAQEHDKKFGVVEPEQDLVTEVSSL